MDKQDKPDDEAHITNGRVNGVEYSLCGRSGFTPEGQKAAAVAGKWCQQCLDADC